MATRTATPGQSVSESSANSHQRHASHFVVHPGWKILMMDMGVSPAAVLKLAGLPEDLFSLKDARLTVAEYFSVWRALEQMSGDQDLPLLIGQSISVEAFDPPIFAAFCSRDLNQALLRMREYKPLIGPMYLDVEVTDQYTRAQVDCYRHEGRMPYSVGAMEMVFLTCLARMGTRQEIVPEQVMMRRLPSKLAEYEAFFGCKVIEGELDRLTICADDASRPFLSENPGMWAFFEPELKKRLADLDDQASTAQRVKSALLEMLPSGEFSAEQVARKLAMSKRTLQRRLNSEGENFQSVLNHTRINLARHYLSHSSLTQSEISFLLGFQDVNSFIRSYSNITGQPPGKFRQMH